MENTINQDATNSGAVDPELKRKRDAKVRMVFDCIILLLSIGVLVTTLVGN